MQVAECRTDGKNYANSKKKEKSWAILIIHFYSSFSIGKSRGLASLLIKLFPNALDIFKGFFV